MPHWKGSLLKVRFENFNRSDSITCPLPFSYIREYGNMSIHSDRSHPEADCDLSPWGDTRLDSRSELFWKMAEMGGQCMQKLDSTGTLWDFYEFRRRFNFGINGPKLQISVFVVDEFPDDHSLSWGERTSWIDHSNLIN